MQRLGWRLCKLKPSEVLSMTIYDLAICLEEGYEEIKSDIRWQADLFSLILNAPFMIKPKHGKVHRREDFLPVEIIREDRKKKYKKILKKTPHQQALDWVAAGNAMMDVVNQDKKERNVQKVLR